MAVTSLHVVLNKWSTVDATGKPKGVCPRDPKITAGSRDFIGMTLDVETLAEPALAEGEKGVAVFGKTYGPGTLWPKGAKERATFCYVDEIVQVENTPFHREMVRRGNLFAADEETYKAIFSTSHGFVEPAKLLEQARLVALRHHGIVDEANKPAPGAEIDTRPNTPVKPNAAPAEPAPTSTKAPMPAPLEVPRKFQAEETTTPIIAPTGSAPTE